MLYVPVTEVIGFSLFLPSAFSLNITHTFSKSSHQFPLFLGFQAIYCISRHPFTHTFLFIVPPELSIVSDVLSSSDGNYVMMNSG